MCENILIETDMAAAGEHLALTTKTAEICFFPLYFFLYISSFMHILTKTYVTLSQPDLSKDISVHAKCVVHVGVE